MYTINKVSKSISWKDVSTSESAISLNVIIDLIIVELFTSCETRIVRFQLPVDLLTSDSHPSPMALTTTSQPTPKRHSSEYYEKSSDDWSVTYKKLQPELPSLERMWARKNNMTKEFEQSPEYDDNDDDEVVLRRVKRKGRRILSSKTVVEKKYKFNLTAIIFSCGSADALELIAECPRVSQIRSGNERLIYK